MSSFLFCFLEFGKKNPRADIQVRGYMRDGYVSLFSFVDSAE